MVNGHIHRICEVEFYLNSPEHLDHYVHGHEDQRKKGTWYFHRYNNGTYKSGTFKGMDLVLGSGNTAGAVLIRSVFDINGRKFIEGPCNTVNHILALCGIDSIPTFTGGQSLNFLENHRGVFLIAGNIGTPDTIFWGPRYGLSNKYPEYKDRYYRFALNLVKKNKNKLKLLVFLSLVKNKNELDHRVLVH